MKRFLVLLTAIILIQSAMLNMTASVALAQETQATSFVSGAVYLDANENGMAEPDELNIAGATVNVRAADDTVFTATTNEYGFYLVSVPQGDYIVWAVDSIGNITAEIPVSLGEVNAAVALDLGVIDNTNDVEFVEVVEATTMRAMMFLPLVNR